MLYEEKSAFDENSQQEEYKFWPNISNAVNFE